MINHTVVHLLRHGEVLNPEGVLYGRLAGYRLSERGLEMAKRVAEYLADEDIAHVVSSPLERAQQTAEPIAARHDVPICTDERVIEAENVFQGLTFGVGDGALTRPRHWKYLRNPFRPSWGEPYSEQASRMLAAMAQARDSSQGREALIVSHQLPIWVTRSFVEGRRLWHDPRHRQCSLASVTRLPTRITRSWPSHTLSPPMTCCHPAANGSSRVPDVMPASRVVRVPAKVAAALVCAVLTLASCSGDLQISSGDGQGFISGDGSTVVLGADERSAAPEVSGTTLQGEELKLSDLAGDVVVLNVWGSWCAPCRAEAETLQEVSREFAKQGVQFLGINTRDDDAKAEAFERNFGITYPSLVDPDGQIQLAFRDTLPPTSIPSTLVIDREGRVAARILGPTTYLQLKGLVEDVASESEPAAS